MVKVSVLLDPVDGALSGLSCRGHAGFGEGGPDLVCAAVSALTGALGIAFSEVVRVPCDLEAADGHFHLELHPEARETPDWNVSQALLRTTRLALEQLASVNRGFIQVRARTQGSKREEKDA